MMKMSLGGRLVVIDGGIRRSLFSINPLQSSSYYPTASRLFCKLSSRKIHSVSCCLDSFPQIFRRPTVSPMIQNGEMEEEAKSGSNADGNDMFTQCIKQGDIIHLQDLLFTKNRDYLVKNNNEQVKVEQLAGKLVIVCFYPLSIPSYYLHGWTDTLMDIYNDCQLNNKIEIVFVAATETYDFMSRAKVPCETLDRDSQKRFDDAFSCMPWTAIPFSDLPSRKRLQRSFGGQVYLYAPNMFVVEVTGRVFKLSLRIINLYGALGFPFSEERIKYLEAKDDAIVKQPSLNALLASPQRDYVISNKGEKVPIHTLEGKVVGLYFYEEEYSGTDLIEELKTAYERLAVEQNFEIVFIYLSDTPQTRLRTTEETFWKMFETMPWLALPFKDPNSKVLKRILEYPSVEYCGDEERPEFVIFGPHGKFIEPFGRSILFRYGTEPYLFTRKAAANLEAGKVKDLKLEMLWDQNTVFARKDGSQVIFSQLSGKRVMLFYERLCDVCRHADSWCVEFLKILKEKYLQMKGTDDEFEVIHVLESKDSVYLDDNKHYTERVESKTEPFASIHIGELPWLVSDESKLLATANFGSRLYFEGYVGRYHSSIFAFDRDGRLARRSFYPTVEDTKFPFYAGDIEEETLSQLNKYLGWNYWDYFENKGRIYSYKNKHTYDYDSLGPGNHDPDS